MNTTLRLCLAAATLALLSACGGGSDPAPTPAEPAATVPESATASVRAYTEFVSGLIADTRSDQQAIPLLLNAAAAPLSETDSPLSLN